MKRIISMLIAVLTALALFSCAKADDIPSASDSKESPSASSDIPDEKQYLPPTYDEEGNYLGFSDIPENYTPAEATEDGCFVIDSINGEKEYGATIILEKTTYGYENWESFEALSAAGENAVIRVAHFINGVGYYQDLHYFDGKYILFENNEFGIHKECEFKYLRRLEESAEADDKPSKSYLYILTDSLELTYEEVFRSMVSSSISQMTKIPFKWLGFTTYFN